MRIMISFFEAVSSETTTANLVFVTDALPLKQLITRTNSHAVKEHKAMPFIHKPSYPQQQPEPLQPPSKRNHKDQQSRY